MILKGTGHSKGEDCSLPNASSTDLLDDDEVMLFPSLNIHNGSLAGSVLDGVRITVFISWYLLCLS